MNERAVRRTALLVMLVGALVSLGIMFYISRRQSSWMLIVLFTGWVLGPYVALMIADRKSGPWTPTARLALYAVMLVSTLGSVAIYVAVVLTGPFKPAFYFLVVPVASWLLAAIVIPTTAMLSRR
jgi:hypothetical protein